MMGIWGGVEGGGGGPLVEQSFIFSFVRKSIERSILGLRLVQPIPSSGFDLLLLFFIFFWPPFETNEGSGLHLL